MQLKMAIHLYLPEKKNKTHNKAINITRSARLDAQRAVRQLSLRYI